MSKLLKRALRIAILPASILVAGKFLSLIVLTTINGFPIWIENDITSFFSIQIYVSNSNVATQINSYSNLITLLLIAIPTVYMLVRKTLLKDIEHDPRTVVRLTKLNILKWVTSQDTTFLQILLWTVFLWIVTGVIVSSTLLEQTYTWIAILAGTLSILCTWGLIRTFEVETAKIYPQTDKQYT